MKKKAFFTSRNITFLAVLLALVIVLQIFGGYIKIGPVNFTLTLVPIVLGAVMLGPLAGLILGFAFGLVTLINGRRRQRRVHLLSLFAATCLHDGPLLCQSDRGGAGCKLRVSAHRKEKSVRGGVYRGDRRARREYGAVHFGRTDDERHDRGIPAVGRKYRERRVFSDHRLRRDQLFGRTRPQSGCRARTLPCERTVYKIARGGGYG